MARDLYPQALFDFLVPKITPDMIRAIALADFGDGEEEVSAYLNEVVSRGIFLADSRPYHLPGCLSVCTNSLPSPNNPGKVVEFLFATCLMFEMQRGEQVCAWTHNGKMANMAEVATYHSSQAAAHVRGFINWLIDADDQFQPRSFHRFASLLLDYHLDPENVTQIQLREMSEQFDLDLACFSMGAEVYFCSRGEFEEWGRKHLKDTEFPDTAVGEYMAQIKDGRVRWLTLLDDTYEDHEAWCSLVNRVLQSDNDPPSWLLDYKELLQA